MAAFTLENHSGYDTGDLKKFFRVALDVHKIRRPKRIVVVASPIRTRGCAEVSADRDKAAIIIAVAPPSKFSFAKLCRITEHELAHASGLEHDDMAEPLLYSEGPTPSWARDLRVRYRRRAPDQMRRLIPRRIFGSRRDAARPLVGAQGVGVTSTPATPRGFSKARARSARSASLLELTRRVQERNARIDAFVARGPQNITGRGRVGLVAITPDLRKAGVWRVTVFDASEQPLGHSEHASYHAAVKSAVVDHGLSLPTTRDRRRPRRDAWRQSRFVVATPTEEYRFADLPSAVQSARQAASRLRGRVRVVDSRAGRVVFVAAPAAARDAALSPTERRVMLKIEGGVAHSLMPLSLDAKSRQVADQLVGRGLVKRLRPGGRWTAERYVLSAAGSHALGTFVYDDDRSRRNDRSRSRRKRRRGKLAHRRRR